MRRLLTMLVLGVLLLPASWAHAQKGNDKGKKPKPPGNQPPPVQARYTVEWVAPRPDVIDADGNVIVPPNVTITGVNRLGDIVGYQLHESGSSTGFIWLSNDDATDGALLRNRDVFAEDDMWRFRRIDALNNQREVVGVFRHTEQLEVNGTTIYADVPRCLRVDLKAIGKYEEILPIESGPKTQYITGMNDHGDLCGFRYNHTNRRATPIVIVRDTGVEQYPFPADVNARAERINNAGQIIGDMDGVAYRLTPSPNLNYEAGTSLVTVSSVGTVKKNMFLGGGVRAGTLTESGSFGGWAASFKEGTIAMRYTDAHGAQAVGVAGNSWNVAMNDEGDIVYFERSGLDIFWKVIDGDTGETIDLSKTGIVVPREGEVPPDFVTGNLLYGASFKGVSRDGVICGECRNYLIFLRPIRN